MRTVIIFITLTLFLTVSVIAVDNSSSQKLLLKFSQEQYDMLKRCSNAKDMTEWNEWRDDNSDTDIYLEGANLSDADLSWTNLSGANLSGADFGGANLHGTNLSRADLRKTSFFKTNLSDADLSWANLSGVVFISAKLIAANFREANLTYTVFYNADLSDADLSDTDLSDANLSEVRLIGANLSRANLNGADLMGTLLLQTNLTDAILTGAKLYGTAREDWNIDGVKCDYIYWDKNGKTKTPKDRYFEPGEFERIYKQHPTIEYIFENEITPIDPLVMNLVVQAINKSAPEYGLKVEMISARGLSPFITFTLQDEKHKGPALAEIRKEYENIIKQTSENLSDCLENTRLALNNNRVPKELWYKKVGYIVTIAGTVLASIVSLIVIKKYVDRKNKDVSERKQVDSQEKTEDQSPQDTKNE